MTRVAAHDLVNIRPLFFKEYRWGRTYPFKAGQPDQLTAGDGCDRRERAEGDDAEQLGELPPKTLLKMDEELISALKPKALGGMTEKQAKKLKPAAVKKFSGKQIGKLLPDALMALPQPSFNAISDLFTPSQLNGLEALQGQGDGENIGGPVI